MNLQFLSLTLDNFGPFIGEHTLALDGGSKFIYITGRNEAEPDIGANGVGKSSLWDALVWVLYGVTTKESRPAISPWPKYKSKGGTKVVVTFKRDGKLYTLLRSRKPNSLLLNDRLVEQLAVNAVLGIGEETFLRAVVIPQKGELFLDMRPEKQSQLFTEALNLDLWLRAARLATKRSAACNSSLGTLNLELSTLDGRISALASSLVQTKKDEDTFEADLNEEIEEKRKQLKDKNVALTALEEKKPKLPPRQESLGKDISQVEETIKDARRELSDLNHRIQELSTKKALLEKTDRDYSAAIKRYEAASQQNPTCPECGQKVSTQHIKIKLETLMNEKFSITEQLTKLGDVLSAAKHSHDTTTDRINGRENDLRSLRVSLDSHKAQKAKYDLQVNQLELEIASLRSDIVKLKERKNPHTETLSRLTTDRKKAQARKEEQAKRLSDLQHESKVFEYWSDAFREIRLSLIEETLEELDLATNNHAEGLGLKDWLIKFSTTKEKASGDISTKFSALLYPPGEEDAIPFTSYSGGESQRWQLAVVFGLAEVLLARAGVQTNLLVLDEPTQYLSQEGIDDLLEHLYNLARDERKAVFLIDHRSLDKGAFDDVIFVEKTAAGARIEGGEVPAAVPIQQPRKRASLGC